MTVTAQIQAHHLPPLCDPYRETCARPFAFAGRAAATNGHAMLLVDGLSADEPVNPRVTEVANMSWQRVGTVSIDRLRAFIRRKQERVRRYQIDAYGNLTASHLAEVVGLFGAVIDATLLRRYLPGVRGQTLTVYGCPDTLGADWDRARGFPALRFDGIGWTLYVMGFTQEPVEVFEP